MDSSCNNGPDPRNYTIWCLPPDALVPNHTIVSITGQCNVEELCVSSRRQAVNASEPLNSGTAFCVSMVNFVEIAQSQLDQAEFAQIVSLENARAIASSMNVVAQAVLTDKTNTTTLQAVEMMISPSQVVPTTESSTASNGTPAGSAVCLGCSTVVVGPLSAGVSTLNARVVLEPNTSGNLFLATLGL